MGNIKLEKRNNRLYVEPYQDGRVIEWRKQPRLVFLTLTEIRTELCLDISRPETQISYREAVEEPGASSRNEDGKYSQSFGWRVVGTGRLGKDSIGLIKEDGTARTEAIDVVDVHIRPVEDSEKESAVGQALYSDARWEDRMSYIHLDLFVPKTQFTTICDELVSGRLSELELGVYIDSFESEVDSGLCEPDMPVTVYIEERFCLNKAYLTWLRASKSIKQGSKHPDPENK